MKAMILAAGRGERMRPLTDHTPKPLLQVSGKPLIAHQLIALATAGIQQIVINISYLAEKIKAALGDGSQYGVHIQYSFEPTALETGGGIYQALPLLGEKPFIVISGDIFTDYPWQQLPQELNSLAHLIMVENPDFHPEGDFVLKNGLLTSEGEPKLTYASMGVLHPDLFKNCHPGAFRLTQVLKPAMLVGKITGEQYHGHWVNVSTPEQFQSLQR